jgi:hypothetical protein
MNRGSDSILSVYSDARAEYTKQLCVFLVPAYFQFFIELLEKAKHDMINEPKKVLWQFQTYLNEIHDWNMEKVHNEIQRIYTNCGCDYLEDLLTAVFIAHTKVLTAIRLSSNKKKIEINVPKIEHFLFKVLCETSKLLWSSTYLFRDGIPGIEKQQNYRNIEQIINEGILQAVRSLVPVKSILKDFVNGDSGDGVDNDEDSEDDEKEEMNTETDMAIPEQIKIPDTPIAHEPVTMSEPITVNQQIEVSEPGAKEISKESDLISPPIYEHNNIDQHDETTQSKGDDNTQTSLEQNDTPKQQDNPPMIIIDDKPNVRFGEFDAVFDSDNPHASDMVYEPKEDDDDVPALEILEEQGIPLSESLDFDDLNEKSDSEEIDGYEDLN